jgi:hypothetical protein
VDINRPEVDRDFESSRYIKNTQVASLLKTSTTITKNTLFVPVTQHQYSHLVYLKLVLETCIFRATLQSDFSIHSPQITA